jgi:hypothetical protein
VRRPRVGGQSIIEYVVIFAIVAVVSVALLTPAKKIFDDYVVYSKGKMK